MLWQAIREGTALSSLYRSVFSLVHTPTQVPIRYVGAFTDGGTRESLRQFGPDNMCAPNFHFHPALEVALLLLAQMQTKKTGCHTAWHGCRFSPNSWESYCSEGVANATAIGLLSVRLIYGFAVCVLARFLSLWKEVQSTK